MVTMFFQGVTSFALNVFCLYNTSSKFAIYQYIWINMVGNQASELQVSTGVPGQV